MMDIQSSLNIQDELDREWVSLYGKIEERSGTTKVNFEKEDANQGISKYTMNADCMSCTDNRATNLNLFKIACINYQPNPVYYQGKTIQRQELLSLQKVIADLAKETIESSFKEN